MSERSRARAGSRNVQDINPIKEEADYERALRGVEELRGSPKSSAESDELSISDHPD